MATESGSFEDVSPIVLLKKGVFHCLVSSLVTRGYRASFFSFPGGKSGGEFVWKFQDTELAEFGKKTTSGKKPKFSFAQEENIAPFTVPAEACHAVS